MTNKITRYFYRALAIILGIVFLAFLIHNGLLLGRLYSGPYFKPFFWTYLFFFILYSFIFVKIYRWNNELKIIFTIFVLAALPRLLLVFINFEFYQPTSDFLNYLRFGQLMLSGNYEELANLIAIYRIPTMGGLAVYNGLIAFLFSPTLLGFQISNVITTSLICVFIYQIGKGINRKVALSATMFFTLYLSNIVASQITNNQHPSVLYVLISMFFLKKLIDSDKKHMSLIHIILSTIFMGIASFMHASALVFFIAYMAFAGAVFFASLNMDSLKSLFSFKRHVKEKSYSMQKKMLLFLCIFLIGYIMIPQAGLQLMYRRGVINSLETHPFLQHFVIGLDVDGRGCFTGNPSFQRLRSYPYDERQAMAAQIIREQLQDPVGITKLIIHKLNRAYFGGDTHFLWYVHYQHSQYRENLLTEDEIDSYYHMFRIKNGVREVDRLTVHFLFLFAAMGLLLRKHIKLDDMYYLQIIVVLGMFLVIALVESQPRYRYPAMPSLAILASAGLFEAIRLGDFAKVKAYSLFTNSIDKINQNKKRLKKSNDK